MFRRNFLKTTGAIATSISLPSLPSFSFKKPPIFEIIEIKDEIPKEYTEKIIDSSIGQLIMGHRTCQKRPLKSFEFIIMNPSQYQRVANTISTWCDTFDEYSEEMETSLYYEMLRRIRGCTNINDFWEDDKIRSKNCHHIAIINRKIKCVSISSFVNKSNGYYYFDGYNTDCRGTSNSWFWGFHDNLNKGTPS